jgi:hypothetical protein
VVFFRDAISERCFGGLGVGVVLPVMCDNTVPPQHFRLPAAAVGRFKVLVLVGRRPLLRSALRLLAETSQRMRCERCGHLGADARPNWNEHALQSLFGVARLFGERGRQLRQPLPFSEAMAISSGGTTLRVLALLQDCRKENQLVRNRYCGTGAAIR